MRLRVLIAEDHESVARQLRRLLEVECDVIDVVNDGQSLVAAVEALTPEVIVSDISMPGLDGLAAARIILERQPNARIVFVTVHDDRAMAQRALRLGAWATSSRTTRVRSCSPRFARLRPGGSTCRKASDYA